MIQLTPERIIRDLGEPHEVLAILDRPITWDNVRHWMAGRRRVPQWAVERIQAHLAERSKAIASAGAGTRGHNCAPFWRAYHARRAREKDEQARKEKGQL
jgi:hypothetical protein